MTNMIVRAFVASMIGSFLYPISAWCADVFVVEAKGVDLAVGQKIDGAQPLSLAVGQRVTLVTLDGRTIKLKGPSEAPPAPAEENTSGDVVKSLKGLIKAREADTSSAGIIRQGTTAFAQPAPWLVEIGHSGDRCLIAGERTVLWRATIPAVTSDMEISPVDHSWTANASWPAGKDKLALPASMTLNDGQAYVVTLDKDPVHLTIHVIPQTVQSDAAKAGWMIEVGCESQAKALIDAMR
jgi:hypothetical protein